MDLLPGRLPQIRLVGSMLVIAAIGLTCGSVAWYRSARPEVEARHRIAAGHAAEAQRWRGVAGWIDDPCLSARRYPNAAGAADSERDDRHPPYVYTLGLYWFPQDAAQQEFVRRHRDEILALCRDRVAYHERMRDRWSSAAWTPWSRPGPDDPEPPITAGSIVDPSF